MTRVAARAAGHDVRLLAPAAAAWVVAAVVVGLPPALAWLLAACLAAPAAAASCGLLAATRRSRRAGSRARRPARWCRPPVVLACALTATVAVAGAAGTTLRESGRLTAWAGERAVAELTGTAVSDAARVRDQAVPPAAARWRVGVAVREVRARGARSAARATVQVLAGPSWASVAAGTPLRFVGRLGPLPRGEDAVALVSALGPPAVPARPAWWARAADRLRAGLARAASGAPGPAPGLVPALVDGDVSAVPDGLADDLRAAGLTHLTAVSGANLAIVTAVTLWLAARSGLRRRARLAVALAALAVFVVVARPEPSVLRAAVMAVVALAGLAAGRRAAPLPLLLAAVALLLVADPWLSRRPGFALSVLATAGIVVLAPAWAARLPLPRPAALAVAVPLAAQAACGPVLVLLQPVLNVWSPVANLLAEPAVAPATVLGVVAALLAPWAPAAAALVAVPAALFTGWVALVARTAARLPGSTVPWPGGAPGALLMVAVTAAAVSGVQVVSMVARSVSGRAAGQGAAAGRAAHRAPPGGPRRPWPVAVVVVVLAGCVAGWTLAPAASSALHVAGAGGTRAWAVAMCDVGQGDMAVVRSGEASAVVVDAGPDPVAAARCLDRLAVRRVDLLVVTHFHADHVDGLPGVLRGPPAQVLADPYRQPAAQAAAALREVAAAGVGVAGAAEGQQGQAGHDGWRVRWRVVAVGAPAPAGEEGTVVNDTSVVLEVESADPAGRLVRLLDLGDLETDAQQHLERRLRSGGLVLDGPVDVVKVAHHGSARQDPGLYRLLHAPVGLIGVGAGNDYGHPAAVTLRMLAGAGTVAHRTDLEGTVVVRTGDGP